MGIQERKAREFHRREQEILNAALELFRDDQWESVTVEQIAQQAEIGKGTIYKHFASKYEIYARLALDFEREILEQCRKIPSELPVLERMKAYTRIGWDAHLSSHELHRVFLYCVRPGFRNHLAPDTVHEFVALDEELNEVFGGAVRQGIEEGIFPNKPMPLLIFGARSAFWGAIQLVWSGNLGELNPDLCFELLSDFITGGLTSRQPPVEEARSARRA